MMRLNKALALILAVSLLVLLPGFARAAQEFNIEAALFAGIFENTWNRMDVRVENKSTSDFQGSILVELQGEYLREVFVEAGKAVTLTLYLPPMGFSSGNGFSQHKISLLDQQGRGVSQETITLGSYTDVSLVAGVMAREFSDFRRITNVLSYLDVQPMYPSSLDFYQFSLNYRAIILSNPDVTLSPQQSANLRHWLESGGLLIIGGGSGWQQSAAPVPSDLLPVRVQGAETISAGELSPLGLPSLEEGNYAVAVGENLGEVLISSPGGKPLLVAKKVGKGSVLWSALDFEAEPLLNAANAETFWQQIFLLRPLQAVPTLNKGIINQFLNGISQDSLAAALSPGKLFLLLLGYIILVGPVNWVVLRKLDRREWAWFVIPAVAVLLTAGFFAYGRIGRGSDAILYQVNVINQFSAQQANVESFSGVMVPNTRKMTLGSDAHLVPFSEEIASRFVDGRQMLALDSPPLWSVQNFVGAKVVDTPGSVEVNVRINGSADRFEAKVTNNSGQDFFDSYVKMGNRWLQVGPLASGETKDSASMVHPDLNTILSRYNSFYGGWFDPSAFVNGMNMCFLGFGDSGQLKVEGINRTVALDIWVQTIDVRDILASGQVTIPRGVLHPTVQGQAVTEDYYIKNYHFFSHGKDSVDLIFSLPDNLDYSSGEFRLYMDNLWGDAEGKISVFNHKSQRWEELSPRLASGTDGFLLPGIEDLVFENRLTVRIDYSGDFGFYLDSIDIAVFGGRTND
jgi:hypothetical protein